MGLCVQTWSGWLLFAFNLKKMKLNVEAWCTADHCSLQDFEAQFLGKSQKVRRGGSRSHIAKDVVDVERLGNMRLDLQRKNADIFASFHKNKGLWSERAARPDIVELIPMAKCMTTVSPPLLISFGGLKEAATMAMDNYPCTKPKADLSVHDNARWAADKYVVVQNHFRSLSVNQGRQTKLGVLNKDFKNLWTSFKKGEEPKGCQPKGKGSHSSQLPDRPKRASSKPDSPKTKAAKAASPKAQQPKGSQFKQLPLQDEHLSQVSQDGFGLPKIPDSARASELDGPSIPVSKQEVRLAKQGKLGVSPMKRPASKMEQTERSKKAATANTKRKTHGGPKDEAEKKSARRLKPRKQKKHDGPKDQKENKGQKKDAQSEPCTDSSFTCAFGAEQSYICHREGKKKPLWVAASVRQSANHAAIKPSSKEQARCLRAQFLPAEIMWSSLWRRWKNIRQLQSTDGTSNGPLLNCMPFSFT